jgi:hypothetical protein
MVMKFTGSTPSVFITTLTLGLYLLPLGNLAPIILASWSADASLWVYYVSAHSLGVRAWTNLE